VVDFKTFLVVQTCRYRALPCRGFTFAAVYPTVWKLNLQLESRERRMSISQEHRHSIIAEFATKADDTGSPEVQIAVLTAEIQAVTEHLQTHPKDYSGRRGLLSKVSRRRQLLDYLKRGSVSKYQAIIARLNIRK
jgi:small subunit ribosomal protein S15